MMNTGTLHRLAAFAESASGGNPAGVWIGDVMPDDRTMQKIAKDVGYSETAFVTPLEGSERMVRYFSPEAEVSFCGHATIAAGAALGSEDGETTYRLKTGIGVVPITVRSDNGRTDISLTSVEPRHKPASSALLNAALSILGWHESELEKSIPPAVAYAGAWHLVLAVSDKSRLANLNYDFEALKALMLRENLTTLQLVWRESDKLFVSRNPFPVGGVVEDPATGASAAALAGYLRDARIIDAPTDFVIRQGELMGRPSLLRITVPEQGGIVVTGAAVEISGQ
jgi:PhzF family phenazine biosynthesis protein